MKRLLKDSVDASLLKLNSVNLSSFAMLKLRFIRLHLKSDNVCTLLHEFGFHPEGFLFRFLFISFPTSLRG